MFAGLTRKGAGALVPFLVLGDPTEAASATALDLLTAGGADALELGLPFSDPTADGPVIQAAAQRALAAGATVASCWRLVSHARARYPELPIGILAYANLIVRRGVDRFYGEAADAGVDSVLIADVPVAEIAPFIRSAAGARVATVLVAPPNADRASLRAIASASRGYTYLTSRPGVTGDRTGPDDELARRIAMLQHLGAPPVMVGFGISTPTHVRSAVQAGAAGAIVGSAIIRQLAFDRQDAGSDPRSGLRLVQQLKAATYPDPIATNPGLTENSQRP